MMNGKQASHNSALHHSLLYIFYITAWVWHPQQAKMLKLILKSSQQLHGWRHRVRAEGAWQEGRREGWRSKIRRWDEFWSIYSSGVQNNKILHNWGDVCSASERRTVQSRADSNLSAEKLAYIGIFTQGRPKLSELLATLLWFTVLEGDLCTLKVVDNPFGTCLELANHLELKSAQVGEDKEAGGLVVSCGNRLVYWLRYKISLLPLKMNKFNQISNCCILTAIFVCHLAYAGLT